jgi:hypothetical protein
MSTAKKMLAADAALAECERLTAEHRLRDPAGLTLDEMLVYVRSVTEARGVAERLMREAIEDVTPDSGGPRRPDQAAGS